MILYIAEKPSLGRAIADVLPRPHTKGDGFIQAANGDYVSWCIGHLLEQVPPEEYDSRYKRWQLEHLPILPAQWQLAPKTSTKKQLGVLRKLVKQADQLIHAGDPDREGQLLVDEVINFLGVSQDKRAKVQRCLISDLNPSAVKQALQNLRSNQDFIPLSISALARSRADWLYGMNMTRAYTLQGRKVGYQGVLSVGRVQTPLLGLVVRRDEQIENFIAKPFYEVLAHLQTTTQDQFTAKWQPSEACLPYMDEDKHVLSKALAQKVVQRIENQQGEVTKAEKQRKYQAPPLPYSLSVLQIEAAQRFGLSAQQVLDACQKLYEQHKLITYPRSDCRYLPHDQHAQAAQVTQAILTHCPALQSAVQQANLQLKSAAWNDKKVDAHHAIIPTHRQGKYTLSPSEANIYQLICRQYLYQFYPNYEYDQQSIEVIIAGGLFSTRANTPIKQGWKAITGQADSINESEEDLPRLPLLNKGDIVHCLKGELLEKMTQPPKYFTDATLLSAMTGIARYVSDPEIRKILKDTDGLGTEATRAGIIELLFKRNFLMRQGKQIRSTPAGRGLIHSLPSSASEPDMTAQWEATLNAISQRQASYTSFMTPLITAIQALIAQSQNQLPTALSGIAAPKKTRRGFKKRKKSP